MNACRESVHAIDQLLLGIMQAPWDVPEECQRINLDTNKWCFQMSNAHVRANDRKLVLGESEQSSALLSSTSQATCLSSVGQKKKSCEKGQIPAQSSKRKETSKLPATDDKHIPPGEESCTARGSLTGAGWVPKLSPDICEP